ncbi:MAG: type 1 glutamine amidotransferase [Bdellovibrionota bacterium]
MKTSKVYILQHSSIVRPYALFEHFEKLKIEVELCTFVPALHALGWKEPSGVGPVLLLGGPQSVYESEENPWLENEIAYVRKCIQAGERSFGICLGGQVLSHILGAKIYKSPEPEVGWYPVQINKAASLLGLKNETLSFFQWHFDAFEFPQESIPLFVGAEPNSAQGYLWKDQVLAIQFHPEMTHEGSLLLCNKFNVPMGTQLTTSACRETDFKVHSKTSHEVLKKILEWFLH